MARDDPSGTFSARPTVLVGGQALPVLSANLANFRMRESQGGMSSLELTIVDWLSFGDGTAGYGATAASPLQLGAELKIFAGPTSAPQEIFDGIVTALETEAGAGAQPMFTLLAEDRLFKMRRKRRSRSFEDASLSDVVKAIASDHGLEAQIADGFDDPVATWVQMNESDLAFLRRLLKLFDADLQLIQKTLQIVAVGTEARATVPLALGDTLLRIRATADLAEQATSTRIGSFDPESGEPVSAEASNGRMGPGAGTDGKSALRPVTGDIREHAGHLPPMSVESGRKFSEAAFGQRARRFVRADGTAQGNAAIRVGSWLNIAGVNPFFVNTYNVIEATHRFDLANGYLTDFIAECAYLGAGA